jgi:hypothetical protein
LKVLFKRGQRKQNQTVKKQADAAERHSEEAAANKGNDEPCALTSSALGPFNNFEGGEEFFCTGAVSGDDDEKWVDPEENTATVCERNDILVEYMPLRIFNVNSIRRLNLAFENPEYTLSCLPKGFATTFLASTVHVASGRIRMKNWKILSRTH